MWVAFVIISIIGAGIGFLLLSEATLGVGVIALSIWVAILARLGQAAEHHRELNPRRPNQEP